MVPITTEASKHSANHSMHYSIKKATVQDALEVARNIRPEDKMEIEGLGHSLGALPFSVALSDVAVSFYLKDGELAGVAGICPSGTPRNGIVWMICTPALTEQPITFVRQAKKWLATVEKDYDILYNYTDVRNVFHHKLLKMLGFKALRMLQPAPLYLPYYEIVKLCA